MNQVQKVLEHMKVAPIDPMQALKYAGIMRLGARIWELRESGHKIGDRYKMVHNRRGERCRVKEYWLIKAKK